MSKKIYITGADGFIGSHLTEALLQMGHEVTALAHYNSFGSAGWLDYLPKHTKNEIKIELGDIRDAGFIMEQTRGMDQIFHLAALIAIPFSYIAPQAYVDTNITGTLNILNAAKENDIPMIHTSTSEVYGTAQYVPIDEKHRVRGQSPYSASKIGADHLAMSFFSSFNTQVKIIRPFNTYGPRQSLRAVIPTIICQLLQGRTELSLGSITPTRDFSYIADTVSGFIKAMNSTKGFGETVNLGSGFEITIEETVEIISSIIGTNVSVIEDQDRIRPRNSEVDRLYASNLKASALFNWQPNFAGKSGFREGLAQTVEWFKVNNNLNTYQRGGYVI